MAYFQTVKIIMAYFHLTLVYSSHGYTPANPLLIEMQFDFSLFVFLLFLRFFNP
jgi:hypothetical protein